LREALNSDELQGRVVEREADGAPVVYTVGGKTYVLDSAGTFILPVGAVKVPAERIAEVQEDGYVFFTNADGVTIKQAVNEAVGTIKVLGDGFTAVTGVPEDLVQLKPGGFYLNADDGIFRVPNEGYFFGNFDAAPAGMVADGKPGGNIYAVINNNVVSIPLDENGQVVLPQGATVWNARKNNADQQRIENNGSATQWFQDAEGNLTFVDPGDVAFISLDFKLLPANRVVTLADAQNAAPNGANEDGSQYFWFTAGGTTFRVRLEEDSVFILPDNVNERGAFFVPTYFVEITPTPIEAREVPQTTIGNLPAFTTGAGGSGSSAGTLSTNGSANNNSGVWFDRVEYPNKPHNDRNVNLARDAGTDGNPIAALAPVPVFNLRTLLDSEDYTISHVRTDAGRDQTATVTITLSDGDIITRTSTVRAPLFSNAAQRNAAFATALENATQAAQDAAQDAYARLQMNEWARASAEQPEDGSSDAFVQMRTTHSSWHLWSFINIDPETGAFNMTQISDGSNPGSTRYMVNNGAWNTNTGTSHNPDLATNPGPGFDDTYRTNHAGSDIIIYRHYNTPTLVVNVQSEMVFTIVWQVSANQFASMEIDTTVTGTGTFYLQTFLSSGVNNYFWIGGGRLIETGEPQTGIVAESAGNGEGASFFTLTSDGFVDADVSDSISLITPTPEALTVDEPEKEPFDGTAPNWTPFTGTPPSPPPPDDDDDDDDADDDEVIPPPPPVDNDDDDDDEIIPPPPEDEEDDDDDDEEDEEDDDGDNGQVIPPPPVDTETVPPPPPGSVEFIPILFTDVPITPAPAPATPVAAAADIELIALEDIAVPLADFPAETEAEPIFEADDLFTIEDNEIPLAAFPPEEYEEPEQTELIVIEDNPIPLAAMPQTGLADPIGIITTALLLSSFTAAVLASRIRKLRKEDA
jgi:hypothetical protein